MRAVIVATPLFIISYNQAATQEVFGRIEGRVAGADGVVLSEVSADRMQDPPAIGPLIQVGAGTCE